MVRKKREVEMKNRKEDFKEVIRTLEGFQEITTKKNVWNVLERIIIVLGWGLIGYIIGSILGWVLFKEVGESIGRIIGLVIGILWGIKSNSYWVFV